MKICKSERFNMTYRIYDGIETVHPDLRDSIIRSNTRIHFDVRMISQSPENLLFNWTDYFNI